MALDMECLLADIFTIPQQYSNQLQIVKQIYEKQKLILGLIKKRVVCTVMTKASIYLNMADFDEAMN